jgi:hypothetical protein
MRASLILAGDKRLAFFSLTELSLSCLSYLATEKTQASVEIRK